MTTVREQLIINQILKEIEISEEYKEKECYTYVLSRYCRIMKLIQLFFNIPHLSPVKTQIYWEILIDVSSWIANLLEEGNNWTLITIDIQHITFIKNRKKIKEIWEGEEIVEIDAEHEDEDEEKKEKNVEESIITVPKPSPFTLKYSTPVKTNSQKSSEERSKRSPIFSQTLRSVKSNIDSAKEASSVKAIQELTFKPFTPSQKSKPSPNTASKADVVMEDNNQSPSNNQLRRSERLIAIADRRPFSDVKDRNEEKKTKRSQRQSKDETKKTKTSIPNDILGRIRSCVIPKDQNLVTLDSVKGNEDVKKAIKINIIYPKINPKIFAKTKPAKTILLHGPPGNGKTMCAQAIANEIGWTFINVHTAMMMSKMFGESERIMNYLFKFAHDNQPCILFFDEIDAVLSCRSSSSNESSNRIVSVFLQNVGGITSITDDQIILIGATNFYESLDPAVRRRFEYKLEVTLPSETVI